MVEVLEILMLICFGCSWPNNIIKSLKTKSTKGKSLTFLILIDLGYAFGITAKILSPEFSWFVLSVYILNLIMVTTDLILYFHYRKREKSL
ncbi:MAG: hypothetical protein UHN02_08220 [Acutalibacteraceae bacterium]|nr:hypothetical protein [Acutalibacteraceae bacterium]